MRPSQVHIALAVLLATASIDARAQEQTAAPCSGPEYRQLDFWVGDWDAEWDNADGSIGAGRNRISRDEFGDCVIYERFSTDQFSPNGYRGMSVSMFHAPVGQWRQTWVDDQGGYFALVGGPVEGEPYSFEVVNTRITETAPHLRMIWQDVEENSFVWRWQIRRSEDEEWTDQWYIRYTRRD